MQIGITGANGYLGSKLFTYLTSQGIACVRLIRKPRTSYERKFVLGELPDDNLFVGIDCLIHAAYDFSQKSSHASKLVNIDGSRLLFQAARANSVNLIIFISSMSSFPGCKSIYGQSKLQIEQDLIARGGKNIILRPGLIYGPQLGGIVAKLSAIARKPLLPIINSSAKLYFCNYTDLAQLIKDLLSAPHTIYNTPLIAANATGYTLRQILVKLGATRLIPLPWQLIWLLLKVIEGGGITLRTGSDNLISLVNQNPNPDFTPLIKLGFNFQEFEV